MTTKILRVSYFSGGVSSAVATKLAAADLDRVMYTHIDDQHEDTLRFVRDCEQWFSMPVEIHQSPLRSVDNACRFASFIRTRNGGAVCTTRLKRAVRKGFEREHEGSLRITWGFDYDERGRCQRIREAMPNHDHSFPLIDAEVTKADAHAILRKAGIRRPAMYDLGYSNNNCIGCLKGGMGYWNKIRVDFPEVFASRAAMERTIGFAIIGKGIWLDELDPQRGRMSKPICEECGMWCEMHLSSNEQILKANE